LRRADESDVAAAFADDDDNGLTGLRLRQRFLQILAAGQLCLLRHLMIMLLSFGLVTISFLSLLLD